MGLLALTARVLFARSKWDKAAQSGQAAKDKTRSNFGLHLQAGQEHQEASVVFLVPFGVKAFSSAT
jgi:hypothetical protein